MRQLRMNSEATMRNAEATQEKILDAAFNEFAEHGIAGARVDRIASSARCNKNLIYIYFGGKEALFQKVLETNLSRVYEEIHFHPDDLPGYAMKVFDFAMNNPKLMRLIVWSNLERETHTMDQQRTASRDEKLALMETAQNKGTLGNKYPPGFLLTAIMSLATAWASTSPYSTLDPDTQIAPDKIRRKVSEVVLNLVTSRQNNV